MTTIDEDHDDALVRGEQERAPGHRQLDLRRASGARSTPAAVAASTIVGGHARMPSSTSRMTGGTA